MFAYGMASWPLKKAAHYISLSDSIAIIELLLLSHSPSYKNTLLLFTEELEAKEII